MASSSPTFRLEVRIDGAPELSRTLAGAVEGVSDFRPLWDLAADDYALTRKEAFATRGRSIGFPWPGYTEAERRYAVVKGKILGYVGGSNGVAGGRLTARQRRSREARALIDQGVMQYRPAPDTAQLRWAPAKERLYPSLTRRGSPDFIFRATPLQATLGTKVPYASNHEFGRGTAPAWAGSYPIPMRKVVQPLGRNFERRIAKNLGKMAAITGSAIATKTADVRAAIERGLA